MRSVTPGPHTESRFRGGRMDKRDSQPNDTDTSRVTRVWQLSMSRSGPVHTKSNRASRCFGPSFAARHRALATNDLSSYASAPTRPARGVVAGRAGAPRGCGTGRLRPLFRADVVPARGSSGRSFRLQAQVRPSGPSPFPLYACWGHDGEQVPWVKAPRAKKPKVLNCTGSWPSEERWASCTVCGGTRRMPPSQVRGRRFRRRSVFARRALLLLRNTRAWPLCRLPAALRGSLGPSQNRSLSGLTTRAPSHPHTPRARERT